MITVNKKKTVCFFTHAPLESFNRKQYIIQDIRILKDLGYEVIIANNFFNIPLGCDLYFSWWASSSILPLIKAKMLMKPIIVIAGGNETMFYTDSFYKVREGYLKTPWYKKIATRFTLRFASSVLIVSNFMKNDTIALGAKNPEVVYNCVDIDKFNISEDKREYITMIFKSDKNVVRLKRAEIFIRSIPNILKVEPNQKFVIIGPEGNYHADLKSLCVQLKIENNVLFLGGIKNTEVVEWLQKTIAYIQISDTETFGVAIAEAMACGTHVVVSNRGAIPEVVGDAGVYVNHNDYKSVSDGILKILNMNEKEYLAISYKLRKRIIDNFSYEQRKEKLKFIIKQLVN